MADGITTVVKYVPNPLGIKVSGDLAGTIGVKEWLELALEEARSIAPVDTGAYRNSLGTSQQGPRGQLEADIRYAIYLEFGTSDTPIFATLRRASETTQLP